MNTRQYPRTLHGANAAFRDANYACAVERTARPRTDVAFGVALILVCVLVAWAIACGFVFGGTAP